MLCIKYSVGGFLLRKASLLRDFIVRAESCAAAARPCSWSPQESGSAVGLRRRAALQLRGLKGLSALHLCALMLKFLLVLVCLYSCVLAGPAAYGLCQTACNAGCMTCYGACGVTFGTTPVGWWAAVMGAGPCVKSCAVVQGTCMATCAATFLAPTP